MFYLLCVVPAIWFLELHEVDRRLIVHSNFNLSVKNEYPENNELSAIISRFGVSNYYIKFISKLYNLLNFEWLHNLKFYLFLTTTILHNHHNYYLGQFSDQ